MTSTNKKQKTPQIVTIIDNKTVIINMGIEDGITKGDAFDILNEQPYVLKDPTTQEVLGDFEQKKQRVYVKELADKYCVCISTYTQKIFKDNMASLPLFNNQTTKTIGKEMNVEPSEINDIISEFNYSTIHVGDKVKKVK